MTTSGSKGRRMKKTTKTLIAIPTLDMAPALFAHSLACMIRPESSRITMISNSLIYTARNTLAMEAIEGGYDRVLWLDSDMAFKGDLMLRLNKHLDDGMDFIAALFFRRVMPVAPVIYRECGGKFEPYLDYPRDSVFEVAGSGFGACMMKTDVLKAVAEDGPIFEPMPGRGEDLSFCARARAKGYKLYCDSGIRVGHVGMVAFGEEHYQPKGV